MPMKQNTKLIEGLIVALLAVTLSCGGAADGVGESPSTPPPTPVPNQEIVVSDNESPLHAGLVPKPIQIGPKTGGNTLQFKEDGITIEPTGGSSIRDDLVGAASLFQGKFASVMAPETLGEIRFTFKDGMNGAVQKYSDVIVRLNYSGSLDWELNGVGIPTCDACNADCAAELFPSVMLNEMSGPILARRNEDESWLAIEYVSIKMQSEACPE